MKLRKRAKALWQGTQYQTGCGRGLGIAQEEVPLEVYFCNMLPDAKLVAAAQLEVDSLERDNPITSCQPGGSQGALHRAFAKMRFQLQRSN